MSLIRWVTRRCYKCNGVFRVKKDTKKIKCPYCQSDIVGKPAYPTRYSNAVPLFQEGDDDGDDDIE